jgi:putative tricarboxylic transport membrane protein
VNNVPGAGGTIGLAQFINSQRGDGGTLLVSGLVMVGAILTNKSPVSLTQTTPIARLTGEYEVVVVPTASKIKTMADLIASLKANPGAVSWAGGSAGGVDHILVGLIAQAVGVEPTRINYVPFSGGGEALAALLGNQVAAGVSGYGEFAPQIQAGKLRALAVSSDRRLSGVEVPTLKEQGINIELANWRGVVAAPGLSGAQRQELIGAVDRMVKSEAWQAILKQKDWINLYLPGDQFGKFIESEHGRIEKVLRSIGLVK